MENQSFSLSTVNPNTFVPYTESGDNFIMQDPMFSLENVLFKANLLPNPNNSINEVGFCYSSDNPQPTIYDNYFVTTNITIEHFIINVPYDSVQMKFVRAYAINDEGITYSSVKEIHRPEFYVGKKDKGGIIFHLYESGEHGLVVTENSIGYLPWGCDGMSIPEAEEVAIGFGYENTHSIVEVCGTNSLAYNVMNFEVNGYNDWYLPSSEEGGKYQSLLKETIHRQEYKIYTKKTL